MKRTFSIWLIVACFTTAIAWRAGAADTPPAKPPPPPKVPPTLSESILKKIEAAVPATAAKPKKARRILVFWRCEGFFHGDGIAVANKALELMGQKTGAFQVDITDDYAAFDNLAKYDAVVLNNTTQLKLTEERAQALLSFVRGGKGIVGIHAATDNFYKWPDGAKMMGGLFDGHPWGGGGTWAFKVEDPGHPIDKAFPNATFKFKDEIYQFKEPYTRADRRVLVTLDLSDPATGSQKGMKRADNDYAVAWIKKEGQGRVFYCGFGHGANVFQDAAMQQFLLNGTQFALGDLEADASPK
jgi:type 1 glutamine amidotransferase